MNRPLSATGRTQIAADRAQLWPALLDPAVLQALIPGADQVQRLDANTFHARLSFGVGRLRSRYDATLTLSDAALPHRLELAGHTTGPLGGGRATAQVELDDAGPGHTLVTWCFDGVVTGPVALAGTTLLRTSSSLFIHRFFTALASHVAQPPRPR